MTHQASEFEQIVVALAEKLAATIQYKYLTGLEYDTLCTSATRVFTSAPETLPIREQKLFSDAPLMRLVSKGQPYRAQTDDQVRADFPDHRRIFKLGCGSLMNLPIATGGSVVGQINLMHESGFYTAKTLAQALDLTRIFLELNTKNASRPANLNGGLHHV